MWLAREGLLTPSPSTAVVIQFAWIHTLLHFTKKKKKSGSQSWISEHHVSFQPHVPENSVKMPDNPRGHCY